MTAVLVKEILGSATAPASPKSRAPGALPQGLHQGLRRAVAAWQERRQRRLAVRELSRIDPRLLADVGIEPGEIGGVVDRLLQGSRRPV
jgi:uncharacterized protein YjiS (DUF1127 family)